MGIDYYNQNAASFIENTVNVDISDTIETFLALVKEKGHILDAGCGSGRDSLFFKRRGYSVTAIDASEAMVEAASKLIQQEVRLNSFQDITFIEEFDGIWACASLLHVRRSEMDKVLNKLSEALKPTGVIFASFKYGDREEERNGRFFNDYNEELWNNMSIEHPEFLTIKVWKTEDIRKDRIGEFWLNVLLKKK